nr:MAG TPA: hypothetical protein [Caudoviricetes sp.]
MLSCKILTQPGGPRFWGPSFFLKGGSGPRVFSFARRHGPGWQRSPTPPAAGTPTKRSHRKWICSW